MKFYAEPNHYVRIARKNLRNGRKGGFYFDANGVYETDDVRLIEALKPHFKHEGDTLDVEKVEEVTEANIDVVEDIAVDTAVEAIEEVVEETEAEEVTETVEEVKPKRGRR